MEFEKAAACKVQTAASTSCPFLLNVPYEGYTILHKKDRSYLSVRFAPQHQAACFSL